MASNSHWIRSANLCLKKLKSVCSFEGKLVQRKRAYMSQGVGWVLSTHGGEEKEFVSGSVFSLSSTFGEGQAWVIICKIINGLGLLIRFCLFLNGSPFFGVIVNNM